MFMHTPFVYLKEKIANKYVRFWKLLVFVLVKERISRSLQLLIRVFPTFRLTHSTGGSTLQNKFVVGICSGEAGTFEC